MILYTTIFVGNVGGWMYSRWWMNVRQALTSGKQCLGRRRGSNLQTFDDWRDALTIELLRLTDSVPEIAIWVSATQWLECFTSHQKVAGSIPIWGSEIVFLSLEFGVRSITWMTYSCLKWISSWVGLAMFSTHLISFLADILSQQNKLALKLKQKRQERIQLLEMQQQKKREEHYKSVLKASM